MRRLSIGERNGAAMMTWPKQTSVPTPLLPNEKRLFSQPSQYLQFSPIASKQSADPVPLSEATRDTVTRCCRFISPLFRSRERRAQLASA